jgi:acyl-CoA synthetase (AMP-forming)/AMP-acid ligase II
VYVDDASYFLERVYTQLTFREVISGYKAFASVLLQKGFKAGDVLLVYAPNSIYYACVFHAVAALGGTVSPANYNYSARELLHQVCVCVCVCDDVHCILER